MIEEICEGAIGFILLIFSIFILLNSNETLAYGFGGVLLAMGLGLFYVIIWIKPKKE